MDPDLVRTSKFLSLVLRHKPEAIGLRLTEEGWADVAELLACAAAAGRRIDYDTLVRVVHENDKRRFSLSPDGARIRARQGHSIEVDLGLAPTAPPARLYHGTVERFLAGIRREGLISGARQHVHLSADHETAVAVGRRRGAPVVLLIDSARMAAEGLSFYLSENGVWLTAHVPVGYIEFPD